MNHHLLKAAVKWLFPFFIAMGVFMLFRGHNEPGGGFIGGLIVGVGYVLKYFKSEKAPNEFKVFKLFPEQVISIGLIVGAGSGLLGLASYKPFMTGVWQGQLWLPLVGNTKFGTPFYFDIGVFLVVVGVIIKIFLVLEEQLWKSS